MAAQESELAQVAEDEPGMLEIGQVTATQYLPNPVYPFQQIKEQLVLDEQFQDDEEKILDKKWCTVHEETRVTEQLLSRANSYLVSIKNGALQMGTSVMPLPED